MAKIESIVDDTTRRERDIASAKFEQATESNLKKSKETISHFFEDIEDQSVHSSSTKNQINAWSNVGRKSDLMHQIIIGEKPVLLLEPMSKREFSDTFKMSISQMEALIELGAMATSIYVRKSEKWNGYDHFSPLLTQSMVNGERLDAYFKYINPNFDKDRDGFTEYLKETIAKRADASQSYKEELEDVLLKLKMDSEEACNVWATRLAYLKTIIPEVIPPLEANFANGALRTAIEEMDDQKNRHISPISIGIGGNSYYGGEDQTQNLGRSNPFEWGENKFPREYKERTLFFERLNYISNYITGAPSLQMGQHIDPAQLIKFVERLRKNDKAEFNEVRDKIILLNNQLAKLFTDDVDGTDLGYGKAEDWDSYFKEYAKLVETANGILAGGVGMAAGLTSYYATALPVGEGHLFAVPAIASASFASGYLGNKLGQSPQIGARLLTNKETWRAFVNLNELRDQFG